MAFAIKTEHKKWALILAMAICGIMALGVNVLPDIVSKQLFGTISIVKVAGAFLLFGIYLVLDHQVV